MWNIGALLLCAILLGGCQKPPVKSPFPEPNRPVAPIVSARYSNEDARDSVGEFETVVRLADVASGMWVADVGAGEGYYTVRLAPLVVKQIFEIIRDLNERDGMTVFLVEQNAYHALKLAHRGYVMVTGTITLSGSGQELLANPEVKAAYLEGGRH